MSAPDSPLPPTPAEPAQVLAPPPLAPGEAAPAPWWRELAYNLRAGAGILLWRQSALRDVRVSVTQLALLALLEVLLQLAADFVSVGRLGQFAWYALPVQGFSVLVTLCCAWLLSAAAGQAQRLLQTAVALQAPIPTLLIVSEAVLYLCENLGLHAQLTEVYWALMAWWLLSTAWLLLHLLALRGARRALALAAIALLAAPPLWLETGNARLWVAREDSAADAARSARYRAVADEAVLYAQPPLLQAALDALQPGRAGTPELYLLALGGYGDQDVFLRETQSVRQLFDERFATRGRSVLLANHPATVQSLPLASTHALGAALRAIGAKMNRDEDVLFLFMTSHGAQDHQFSLELWPYRFGELTPQSLRQMLDDAGIRQRVLVVSACYSGGFIAPLSDPHTLVITASRADRSSHGCSHEAEWTFFGKALFDEALRHTYDFVEAFALARSAVAQREADEGLEASEPQMALGAQIAPRLQELAALAAARASALPRAER